MQKILLTILAIILILSGATLAVTKNTVTKNAVTKNALTKNTKIQGGTMDFTNKKILIAYFSWGGNTKSIAQKIQAEVGGDMFQIETVVPYPTDYNETAYGIAKEQHEKNIHPEIKNTDISSYDIIFVGTPAWWYTMAPAVMTFLEENNFENKIIIPFITHGGGGKYTIAQDMEKLAKNAKVINNPFVVYEKGDSETDKNLKNWLKELK